jgi:hypothetical protein
MSIRIETPQRHQQEGKRRPPVIRNDKGFHAEFNPTTKHMEPQARRKPYHVASFTTCRIRRNTSCSGQNHARTRPNRSRPNLRPSKNRGKELLASLPRQSREPGRAAPPAAGLCCPLLPLAIAVVVAALISKGGEGGRALFHRGDRPMWGVAGWEGGSQGGGPLASIVAAAVWCGWALRAAAAW